VNADGKYGQWAYRLVKKPEDVVTALAARAG
jgi:hypothetical protein